MIRARIVASLVSCLAIATARAHAGGIDTALAKRYFQELQWASDDDAHWSSWK